MAKKKTAIPDSSTDKPAAPRRRSPKQASTTARISALDVIEAAADMSSTALPSSNGVSSPSYEEIAEAAYHRYLSRGGEHGQDWDDWIAAEHELRTKR